MRVWDDGCVLWCVGGTSEYGKMTVLQFEQLMLVPFGPTFSRCKKSYISLRCRIFLTKLFGWPFFYGFPHRGLTSWRDVRFLTSLRDVNGR